MPRGVGKSAPFERYAWLALPILLACAVLALVWDDEGTYPVPRLHFVAHVLFLGAIPMIVAALGTWSFVAGGVISLLFLACGMFTLSCVGVVAGSLTSSLDYNLRTSLLSPILLLAGFWHVLSVFSSLSGTAFRGGLRQRLALLSAVGLTAIAAMVLVALLVVRAKMPSFYTSEGPTPLRQAVIIATLSEFLLAGLLYRTLYRRLKEPFLHWYSMSLLAFGAGLLMMYFSPAFDSVLSWLGRVTQYLGCSYLLVGTIGLIRGVRRHRTPLHWRLSAPFHMLQFDFRPLTEQAEDAVLFLDGKGRVMYANARATQLFGEDIRATPGARFQELIVPGDESDAGSAALLELFQDKHDLPVTGRMLDVELCGKDRHRFPARVTVLRNSATAGSIGVVVIKDVSAEKEAERNLRKLALELSQAEQRERRRLAQLLHDHLQQLLVAAKMTVFTLAERSTEQHLAAPLRELTTLLDDAVRSTRSLTVELSPPVLHDLGLGAALRQLAAQAQERYPLRVEVAADANEAGSDDLCLFFYHAARELLLNAAKHAHASSVQLRLARDEHQFTLQVEDNGIGIRPDALTPSHAGGFGLFSLRERAHLLGGTLDIASAPEKGALLTLRVPAGGRAKSSPLLHVNEQAATSSGPEHSPMPPPANVLRVLVADDHQILREGLVSLIELEEDLEVVGQAADGEAAVAASIELQPDVIVMDVNMPRLSGIEATRRVKDALPQVRIIGLSMYEEDEMASAMIAAGAFRYLNKGGPSEALLGAIRGTGASVVAVAHDH